MADKETTSIMRSLCMGRIEQDVLFPFPTMSDAEKETLGDIAGALEGLLGPRAEDRVDRQRLDLVGRRQRYGLWRVW